MLSGEVQSPPRQKTFASVFSVQRDGEVALEDVIRSIKGQLGNSSCDALLVFVSESYEGWGPGQMVNRLTEALACPCVMGCNASGVIGTGRETEMAPAISVLAMHLPEVTITPFALTGQEINALRDPADLLEALDVFPTDRPNFILLADPQHGDTQKLLTLLNEAYPDRPVVGGLASGASVGSENWVADGGQIVAGAIGWVLTGRVEFETVVAQGCRPIGTPYIITKAEEHRLMELAGRPAIEVLGNVFKQLTPEDQALARRSLLVGLVMKEQQASFKRGDFLIRNLMGVDGKSGSLIVGAHLKVGQTLQFQLRDADTSSEDLNEALEKLRHQDVVTPRGGILVSCCGRGRGLYGVPDHDAAMVKERLGAFPLTGFFANGEIGPVGSKNYLHGFTSSLVVIR